VLLESKSALRIAIDEKLIVAMKTARRMMKLGMVKSIGICNATVAQLEVIDDIVGPMACVQASFSLWDKAAALPLRAKEGQTSRRGLLDWCQRHGVVFIPHGALGGLKARDGRRDLGKDFPKIVSIAKDLKVLPHALVLAWMKRRWPCILHIVGMRTEERVTGLAEARRLVNSLRDEQLRLIDEASGFSKDAFSLRARELQTKRERIKRGRITQYLVAK